MFRVALAAIGFMLLAAPLARAEQDDFNVEDLPRKEILLPDGRKTYNVQYLNRLWWEVDPAVLQERNLLESKDISFEAKFDMVRGSNEIKLLGVKGHILCQDPQKVKQFKDLKRGDNIWLCGTLKPAPEGQSVDFFVAEFKRLPKDLPRFERRYELYKERNDADAMEDLGHRITKLINSQISDFNQHDQFVALRTKSWSTSIQLRKRELQADDADGLYNLAVKTNDLLRRPHEFHEMIRQVLKIDPNHPQASRVAREEMDMVKLDGRWMTREDQEKLVADEATRREQMEAAQREAFERKQRMREAAAKERQKKLGSFMTALRTQDLKKLEGALRSLGEAVRDTPDPLFGRMGIDVLASVDDPASVKPGLDLAVRCEYPDVRRDAFEALAWRGDEPALATFSDALRREEDLPTARAGVDALVRRGGKQACAVLVESLGNESDRIGSEVVEGLKSLTGQAFGTREEWERWWQANKERTDLRFSATDQQ
ncbi:MAG: HEAT repeat domain-containing protein [Planctomycetota bacterium]|nr:HEAT repeat domain-containing protein [Planctomycetota bacterium]